MVTQFLLDIPQTKYSQIYSRAFSLLKDFSCYLTLQPVLADIELAAINAFKKAFPNVNAKVALFTSPQLFCGKSSRTWIAKAVSWRKSHWENWLGFSSFSPNPNWGHFIGIGKIYATVPLESPLQWLLEIFERTWLGSTDGCQSF